MPPTSKMYLPHVLNLYAAMKKECVRRTVDKKKVYLWQGRMTDLQRKLGIPVPYYGRVLRALIAMGCMSQYRRGSRGSESVWILHQAPTEKLYEAMDTNALDSPRGQQVNGLQQQINDFLEQFGGLDIRRTLIDVEKENRRLKDRVGKIEDRLQEIEDSVIQ